MQAKRPGRRLSGNTVPAATRAAQSVCVCIEPPPRDFKTGCQLLLSYYPLPAPWAAPTSSQKLWVMLRWGLEGGEAVLKLRALYINGDFDEYWELHEQQEYQRNHQAKFA